MAEKDKERRRDHNTPNTEENQESKETQEQIEPKKGPYFRPVDIPGDEEQPDPEETSTGFVMVDPNELVHRRSCRVYQLRSPVE